jgi:hypothetical protein
VATTRCFIYSNPISPFSSNPASDNICLFVKLATYRPMRVQSNDGTLCTHWTGWLESIEPSVNQYGERIKKGV